MAGGSSQFDERGPTREGGVRRGRAELRDVMGAGRGVLVGFGLVVALLGGATLATAATTVAPAEDDFVGRIAAERSAHGLAPLAEAADLVDVARRHAARMVERGEPHHNTALGDEVSGWKVVGENVGRGADVDELHRAFMASSTHRDQILGRTYTELGVGVLEAHGDLWVVQVFREPMDEPAPSSSAPPPGHPRQGDAGRVEPAPGGDQPSPVPAPAPSPAASAGPATGATGPSATATTVPVPPDEDPGTALVDATAWSQRRPYGLAGRDAVPGPTVVDFGAGAQPVTYRAAVAAPDVPAPVALAAGLLALVVGAQGVTVRRLGLA